MFEGLSRELRTIRVLGRTGLKMLRFKPGGTHTVAGQLEEQVDRTPSATALRFEGESVSYRNMDEAANRVAAWARSQGVGHGDVVALLMENRPEFIITWFGLAKLGAVTALINTNLAGAQLAHAITVSGARELVVDAALAERWTEIADELQDAPRAWVSCGEHGGCLPLDPVLATASSERPPASLRDNARSRDDLFYIYTSGTTGNPKAAHFSNFRFLGVGAAYTVLAEAGPNDKVYCVLPLYHSSGGVIAVATALLNGGCLVIRRRFSASAFWRECTEEGVTIFLYIGELCRYLLHGEPSEYDRAHSVRCAVGNGLRPDIWEEFRDRFGLAEIREFYGATEANFALINVDNTVGSVGRVPAWAKPMLPVELVRYDVESDSHPRDAGDFMIACGTDEVGEAVCRMPADKGRPVAEFEGYTDREASERKVLRDVFESGDRWYRSGDLLRRDADGYFYFVDRIGDTFRWKGENVSTNEVAEQLTACAGVSEATVYGVEVPGADGRAGMAALVVDGELDLAKLYSEVTGSLAAYAQPLFLRLVEVVDVTGTFKHRKTDMVREGFDPAVVADPLLFRDDEAGCYAPLDEALREQIVDGRVRV